MSSTGLESYDLTNPGLASAWKELADGKTQLTWIAFAFNGTTLEPFESGTQGFLELKGRMKSQWATRLVYGCLAVDAEDRRSSAVTSKRRKLVAFSFTGTAVDELERANGSFIKAQLLAKLFPSTHLTLEILGRGLTDFNELSVAKQLHNASAAHKPSHYIFYGKSAEVSVADMQKKEDDSDEEFDD